MIIRKLNCPRMQETRCSLLVILCIACLLTGEALAFATVEEFNLPVWIQHNNNKTELSRDSKLEVGNHVITGDTGEVVIQLWTDVTLRISPSSELRFLTSKKHNFDNAFNQPAINILRGQVCVENIPGQYTGKLIELDIGNSIVIATSPRSHICLLRESDLTSVELYDGSAQVTHSIDPSTIILSQSGTRLQVNDDGSYELLNPAETASQLNTADEPFTTKANTGTQSQSSVPARIEPEVKTANTTTTGGSESQSNDNQPSYVYTVYLFSTRSADKARELNEELQKAGHQSKIIVRQEDASIRYRVAVSDFASMQAAREYADSIVGRLGIFDTWIGKSQNENK